MNSQFFVSINENFLDNEMFETLKHFGQTTDIYDKNINDTIWSQRVAHATQASIEIREIGKKYIELVKNKIMSDFNLEQEIYTDILCFNRWRIGDMQHPHADEANGFGWRKFGCVLYFNEDYEGGSIYFPNKDIEVKPKANTLAFFPGNDEYLHGVHAITEGIRYTLSTFWGYEPGRAVRL